MNWKPLLAVLAFATAADSMARAEVIGVGLDFRKMIYVQEYWRDGKPYYSLVNLRPPAHQISVTDRKTGEVIAGPWEVKSLGVLDVEASKVQGKDLVQFQLGDGIVLGLLSAPVPLANPVKGSLATYDGLNGSGGRHTDLWCEQSKRAFQSEEVIELKLMVPSNAGLIKFSTKSEENQTIRHVPLSEASCDTLPVEKSGAEIQINTNKPLKEEKLHTVTLRFKAPKVNFTTIVMITGWRATSNAGGHGITRGIVVLPADK